MSDGGIFMWGHLFPEEVEIDEYDEEHYDAIQFEIFLCDELGLDALVELDLG
jgi:hypothetical protein